MTGVAEFLQFLKTTEWKGRTRSHRTIAGFRSAIGSIHKGFEDGTTSSTNPTLTAFMKGLYHDMAKPRSLIATWDLPLVLNYLAKPPFEPMHQSSLRDLTIKTAFLIQLASARRVSWTHAIKIGPGNMRKENGGYRFLPELALDKNQTPSFSPSPVFIPSLKEHSPDDSRHCPIRALGWYLERTKDVRGNEQFLFITSREPHTRARKSTVSSWIKQVITSAHSNFSASDTDITRVRAHDTRAVATSWARLAGISMEDIMDAAAWKVPQTFVRFYLKDLAGTKGRFGNTVLKTAGSAPSTSKF